MSPNTVVSIQADPARKLPDIVRVGHNKDSGAITLKHEVLSPSLEDIEWDLKDVKTLPEHGHITLIVIEEHDPNDKVNPSKQRPKARLLNANSRFPTLCLTSRGTSYVSFKRRDVQAKMSINPDNGLRRYVIEVPTVETPKLVPPKTKRRRASTNSDVLKELREVNTNLKRLSELLSRKL